MGHKKSQKQCPPVIVIQGRSDSCKESRRDVIKSDLKVCGNAHFKKDVEIDGSLTVKGLTRLNGGLNVKGGETVDDLTVNDSLIIPRVDITTTSPVGKQADLVYDTSDTFVNDNQLHISDGKEWLTIPANPVGGVYTIGIDFPTIQAGIDYCSSGLKPVANSNIPLPLPPGVKNVTLNIPPGLYTETLYIDTSFSTPEFNDPGTDMSVQSRGLRLVGDTRPIAGFTYMNGGIVECDSSYVNKKDQNFLGTQFSPVTLSNSGNAITVTLTATGATQPNFTACGIVPGDIIVVTDNTGNFQQRNVISVSAFPDTNTINYDGSPVSINGLGAGTLGAAITFMPNVRVMSASPDAICMIESGTVEMVGIWFSGNPLFFNPAVATTITASFIQPSVGSQVTISVGTTYGYQVGQSIVIANGGTYIIDLINSGTSLTITNTGATNNVAPTTTIPTNSAVTAETITTASYIQPDVDATVTISVISTVGFTVGQQINIVSGGRYNITAIGSSTSMTVSNTGALTSQYVSPGTTVSTGALVSISSSIYNVGMHGYSRLFFLGLVLDARNLSSQEGLQLYSYSRVNGNTADDDIVGHMSSLGCAPFAEDNSSIYQGHYYCMAPLNASTNVSIGAFITGSLFPSSIQANGAVTGLGVSLFNVSTANIAVLLAFNCSAGIRMSQGSNLVITSYIALTDCTTGIVNPNGNLGLSMTSLFHGLTPTITGGTTAINISSNGVMNALFPLTITGATTGIELTTGAKLASASNIIFNSVTNKYAIDATSLYLTPQNAGTDPSHENIYTYPSTVDLQQLNSAYLNQLIPNVALTPETIQLNPSIVIGTVQIYVGKIYNLYSTGSASPQRHVLALTSGNFTGVGSSGKTIAVFAGISEGEGLTFLVVSSSRVQVIAFNGVTFS